MKFKEVKDKLSKSQNRYEQIDDGESESEEDDFSFELQQATYALVIEVNNRGEAKELQKDVAALKEFFCKLETTFPGQ